MKNLQKNYININISMVFAIKEPRLNILIQNQGTC